MSPMLKSVEKVGIKAVRRKRNPIEIPPEAFFTETEILRGEFAKLIHASDSNRVAIIPSVSYGISTAAQNLKIGKGEEVIVASAQFPSNYYPWKRICDERGASITTIAPPDTLEDRGAKWNEKILTAITTKTKAVAIAHTHWADGTKFDLQAIRKKTRELGAALVIDGTQSVGAMPFDASTIQPDALIVGGYKWLLGPYSIGLAYFSDYFLDGKPLEENWIARKNSEDFSKLIHYEEAYQEGALRFDVGEKSNFILVPMMIAALKQLNKWKVENIQAYCEHITRASVEKLRERGFWIEHENFRGSHLIGIRVPAGFDMQAARERLLKNRIYVSYRGDSIRLAPNVYNDESDVKKFVKVLCERSAK